MFIFVMVLPLGMDVIHIIVMLHVFNSELKLS